MKSEDESSVIRRGIGNQLRAEQLYPGRTMAPGKKVGMLYCCVIDRFCYESLDAALAHARIQHGLAEGGETLVRTKMVGGLL